MKFIDIYQHDPITNEVNQDWLDLRIGKATTSNFGCIMANYGKAFGAPAQDYALQIAIEQITGVSAASGYTNSHMQRGNDEEPIACELYSNTLCVAVSNGGFFDGGLTGCSPDGLVGDDGVIEIKSAIFKVHKARVKRQSYDPAYKWQLVGNLMHTGRDWIDFISYCSSYPDTGRLYVHRSFADEFSREFKMVESRLAEFHKLVEKNKEEILLSDYIFTERKVS